MHELQTRKEIMSKWPAAFVLLAALWSVHAILPRSHVSQLMLNASSQPRPQIEHVRVWHPWRFVKINNLDTRAGVKEPGYLHVGANNAVTFLDGSSLTIRQLRATGLKTLLSIPDNALSISGFPPTDVAQEENGTFWMCNPNGRVINVDANGTVTHALPRELKTLKVTPLRDGIVLMLVGKTKELFALYKSPNEPVKRFGTYLAQPNERSNIILSGWIAPGTNGTTFTFVPRYGGFIASYDEGGNQRFLVNTVDAPPLPGLKVNDGGSVSAQLSGSPVWYLTVVDSKILILKTDSDAKGHHVSLLDVYRETDGGYMYSVRLPEAITEIAASGGLLYTKSAGAISVWKGDSNFSNNPWS